MRKGILLSVLVTLLGLAACNELTGSSGGGSSETSKSGDVATTSNISGLWTSASVDSGSGYSEAYTEYIDIASNGTFTSKYFEVNTYKVDSKDSVSTDSGSSSGNWSLSGGMLYVHWNDGSRSGVDTADVSIKSGKLVAIFHNHDDGKLTYDTTTYAVALSIVVPPAFKNGATPKDTAKAHVPDTTVKNDTTVPSGSIVGLWTFAIVDSGSGYSEAYTEYIAFASNGTLTSKYFEVNAYKVGSKDSISTDSGSNSGNWSLSGGMLYVHWNDESRSGADTVDVLIKGGKLIVISHNHDDGKLTYDTTTYAAASSIVVPPAFKNASVPKDTTKVPVINPTNSDTGILGLWTTKIEEEGETNICYINFTKDGQLTTTAYSVNTENSQVDTNLIHGTWTISGNTIITVEKGVEEDYPDTATFSIRNGVLTIVDTYTDEGQRVTDTTIFTKATAVLAPSRSAARVAGVMSMPTSSSGSRPWPIRKRLY